MATTLGRGPKTIQGCEGISQRHVIDVDKDPRESVTTVAVFFAVAAGYAWGIPSPYLDLVEELADGSIQRRVYWTWDAESVVEIEGRKFTFSEFWDGIHDVDLNPARSAMHQLAQARAILAGMAAADRSDKLRYWAGHASLAVPAKAIFDESAKIYDQFLKDRMPRFIYVEQARGMTTNRAYIPVHATPEERAEVLARAGIS